MSLITPNWPAPKNIRAYSTTRLGGESTGAYGSFNLGDRVNDAPESVQQNRQRLRRIAQLPCEPEWLEQVHGIDVAKLDHRPLDDRRFDAAYTRITERICAVMTADCLPVLLCSSDGKEVAAIHAGWRGLCNGILENGVRHFTAPATSILAWLGPAIGPSQFEVGAEVKEAFMVKSQLAANAFQPYGDSHYLANLYALAKQRLTEVGLIGTNIYGGDRCTFTESDQFFSYRRDRQTGRMASLIWIAK